MSCIIKDHLLIQGGISEELQTLTDLWSYNLTNNEWEEVPTLDQLEPRSTKKNFNHTIMYNWNDDGSKGSKFD